MLICSRLYRQSHREGLEELLQKIGKEEQESSVCGMLSRCKTAASAQEAADELSQELKKNGVQQQTAGAKSWSGAPSQC